MAWDFSTDPAFERTLAWIREFVDETIIPLDLLCEGLNQRQLDALWAPSSRRSSSADSGRRISAPSTAARAWARSSSP